MNSFITIKDIYKGDVIVNIRNINYVAKSQSVENATAIIIINDDVLLTNQSVGDIVKKIFEAQGEI